jgi:hypothetical protein
MNAVVSQGFRYIANFCIQYIRIVQPSAFRLKSVLYIPELVLRQWPCNSSPHANFISQIKICCQ